MAVEELGLARAGVLFGQFRDRREKAFSAEGALLVAEDLDRHRRVFGAEAGAFLRHAAEELLRFADPFDVDGVLVRLLRGDVDDPVTERQQGEEPDQQHPAAPAPRHRPLQDFGLGFFGRGAHPAIIATRDRRHPPTCVDPR